MDPKKFPDDGIVCFHCGMHMSTWREALAHFGPSEENMSQCVRLLPELRKILELPENTDISQILRAVRADRQTAGRMRAVADNGEPEFGQVMEAECRPDIYERGHPKHWFGSAEGDKDGPTEVGDSDNVIHLAASTFPPGTRIIVEMPACPKCGTSIDLIEIDKVSGLCECEEYNWREWIEDRYT